MRIYFSSSRIEFCYLRLVTSWAICLTTLADSARFLESLSDGASRPLTPVIKSILVQAMLLAKLKQEAAELSPDEQSDLMAFLASIQIAEDDEKPVTNLAKFVRWIVVPVGRLRQIRNGDGAFAALNLGFALCERYYRDKSNTESKHWKNKDFKVLAAHDMGVDLHFFEQFWTTFRDGLAHQATPKTETKNGITFKWRIGGKCSAVPTRIVDGATQIICLDPWKFTDSMIQRYLNEPELLSTAVLHIFGSIYTEDTDLNDQPVPPSAT